MSINALQALNGPYLTLVCSDRRFQIAQTFTYIYLTDAFILSDLQMKINMNTFEMCEPSFRLGSGLFIVLKTVSPQKSEICTV